MERLGEMMPDFDAQVVWKRVEQLDRLLDAHKLPEDREMATAILVVAVRRLVAEAGPEGLSPCVAAFVDIWRDCEVQVVKRMVKAAAMDSILEKMTDKGPRH